VLYHVLFTGMMMASDYAAKLEKAVSLAIIKVVDYSNTTLFFL
jgi:hypothetical protein